MKKISRILISICFLFVMSFSLISCSTGSDNDDSSNKYTPPKGVDMTSAIEYATWLNNNADITQSYEMKRLEKTDNEISEFNFKYQYKNGLIIFGMYDKNNTLRNYSEIEPIASSAKIKIYNISSGTYFEDLLSGIEYISVKANANFSDAMAYMFLNSPEVNYNGNLPENIKVSRTIEKLSEGKYLLKQIVEDTEENVTGELKYIYENNRIISYEMTKLKNSSVIDSIVITYNYKNVSINFDKSNFYVPPQGVDMSSANDYATWLSQNTKETESYEIKIKNINELNETTSTHSIKYQYKDGIKRIAYFNGDGELINYIELQIEGDIVKAKTYNPKTLTYMEESLEDYYKSAQYLLLADIMPYYFLNFETQGSSIKKDISMLSEGKYLLNITEINEYEVPTKVHSFTYLDDKIIEYIQPTFNNNKTIYTYEYKVVEINFDATNYTKQNVTK